MKLAVLALVLLPMTAALAQTPPQSQSTPVPAPSDLDARLHHQPTQADVTAREKEREGSAVVDQRNQQEKQQVDQLYQQLLGKPASQPGKSGQ